MKSDVIFIGKFDQEIQIVCCYSLFAFHFHKWGVLNVP